MKPTIYLETTVISYLTARQSRDLVTAANQQITRDWWTERRNDFELFVSEAVVAEVSAGDAKEAKRRTELIRSIDRVATSADVIALAKALVDGIPLPLKAHADAMHVSASAVHGIEYLLTWNCTHIANAVLRPKINRICRDAGFEPPIICTPLELLGRNP